MSDASSNERHESGVAPEDARRLCDVLFPLAATSYVSRLL